MQLLWYAHPLSNTLRILEYELVTCSEKLDTLQHHYNHMLYVPVPFHPLLFSLMIVRLVNVPINPQ